MNQQSKVNREKKHKTEQEVNDMQLKKSQLDRLDKLIRINHVKLNKWFHLDNPNGFGFPDEIWSLIKSYNPAPIKALKELKYSRRNNEPPRKVIMFKRWKTIANGYNIELRRTNIGSWFLYNPSKHFYTMFRMLHGVGSNWNTEKTRNVLKDNNCTIEEFRGWAQKKGYWSEGYSYCREFPITRYTNFEMIREDWDNDYWFIYVTHKNQNFLNLRFIWVKENRDHLTENHTYQLVVDNTICKKIKIGDDNEFDEIKLTSKDRKKILEGTPRSYFSDELELNKCMPIEFVKNVMPNSNVMKAFGKVPNIPRKLHKCWEFV